MQFFNGGSSIFYDFTIESVALKNTPSTQRMGEIVNERPQLIEETITRESLSSEQVARLVEVLKSYGLHDMPTYQIGHEPDGGRVIGFLKSSEEHTRLTLLKL